MDGVSDDPQAWTLAVQSGLLAFIFLSHSSLCELKVPATLVHGVAILATMFRLLYRCYLSRFSWEDAWATSALICDIACLASVWMEAAPDIREFPSIRHLYDWKTVSFQQTQHPR
jgi:hypothetical protein